ncbi:MAG: type II secretion system protein GspM [Thermodesulfobacteriota bacterium]
MNISKRVQGLLAIAGVLALLVAGKAVYGFLVAHEQTLHEKVELKAALLERYRSTVEAKKDWEPRRERGAEALKEAGGLLFKARTQALAAARLQKFVQTKAREHKVNVKSVRIAKAVTLDEYSRVSVVVVTESGIRGLVDLLHDIDTSGRLMTVSAVTAKGSVIKGSSRLSTTLTVDGLAVIEEGGSG